MGINKGHQLIEWRNKLELNQLEMSRLLGISQYKLNAYETNEELATEMIMNDFGLKVSELQDPTPNQCKKSRRSHPQIPRNIRNQSGHCW